MQTNIFLLSTQFRDRWGTSVIKPRFLSEPKIGSREGLKIKMGPFAPPTLNLSFGSRDETSYLGWSYRARDRWHSQSEFIALFFTDVTDEILAATAEHSIRQQFHVENILNNRSSKFWTEASGNPSSFIHGFTGSSDRDVYHKEFSASFLQTDNLKETIGYSKSVWETNFEAVPIMLRIGFWVRSS